MSVSRIAKIGAEADPLAERWLITSSLAALSNQWELPIVAIISLRTAANTALGSSVEAFRELRGLRSQTYVPLLGINCVTRNSRQIGVNVDLLLAARDSFSSVLRRDALEMSKAQSII